MRSPLILVSLLLLSTPFAHADDGGINGGGGGAYVCRNADGSVRSAKWIDLWETEHNFARKRKPIYVRRSNRDPELQFADAVKKLRLYDPEMADAVVEAKAYIFDNKDSDHRPRDLLEDEAINLPEDLKTEFYPTGCPPTGVLLYHDFNDYLSRDSQIFDKLETKTDVAAAWMHEALYKIARRAGMKSSRNVRRIVGCLFAERTDVCWPREQPLPANDPMSKPKLAFHCLGDGVDLLVHPYTDIKSPRDIKNGMRVSVEVDKLGGLTARQAYGTEATLGKEFPDHGFPDSGYWPIPAYQANLVDKPLTLGGLDLRVTPDKRLVLNKYLYFNQLSHDPIMLNDFGRKPITCKPGLASEKYLRDAPEGTVTPGLDFAPANGVGSGVPSADRDVPSPGTLVPAR